MKWALTLAAVLVGSGWSFGQAAAPAGAGGAAQAPVVLDPIAQVAPARAAAAGASVRLWNAEADLATFLRTQRFLFETSPAYVEALAAQRQASQSLEQSRDRVLAVLMQDPNHSAAVRLRERMGHEIESLRLMEIPDAGRIETLTRLRLNLGSKISSRQAEALSADAGVTAAREALRAAHVRLSSMRLQFEISLRTGAELARHRDSVQTASEHRIAAITFAHETARTASILMEFAYHVQELSLRRPYVIVAPYSGPVFLPHGYWEDRSFRVAPVSVGGGFGLMPGQ